jgi:hypothetical protein
MGFRQVTQSGVFTGPVNLPRSFHAPEPKACQQVLEIFLERINNAVRFTLLRLTSPADSPSYRPAADYNLASSSPHVSWGRIIRLTIAHAERP